MRLMRWIGGILAALFLAAPVLAQDCMPRDPVARIAWKAEQARRLEEAIQRACRGQSANCYMRMQEATDPGYPGNGVVQPRLCDETARPTVSPRPVQPRPQPVAAAPVPPQRYTNAAVSGPRYALVVGNSSYGALGILRNPVNDAHVISAALRRSGFHVVEVTDADQRTLKRSIADFGHNLSARRGSIGLFYYAGHGAQTRGINYLIPVGARIEAEADLDLEGIDADTIMHQLEGAGAATSIVILDACRNMPLQRSLRGGIRGLARMDAPTGSFVAYSTAPGAVAADGEGDNSPFARALASEMGKRGQDIEAMFRNVRKRVLAETNGQQIPWDSSSLVETFVFSK